MHHRCQKLMVHKMHPTPDHAGLLRLRLGAGWAWMRLSNSGRVRRWGLRAPVEKIGLHAVCNPTKLLFLPNPSV
jgi:hypothetical protein